VKIAPPWFIPAVGAGIAAVLLLVLVLWARSEGAAGERPKTEAAADAGASARLSYAGSAKAANASAALARIERAIKDSDHDLDLEAARDVAGDQVLPGSVVDRLQRGDERLCASVPALCSAEGQASDRPAVAAEDRDPG